MVAMNADAFLRLLQFSDGLFPAGAYAHSFGLETCVQSGRVKNGDDVASFLRAYLEGSAAPMDAIAALCSRQAAIRRDISVCVRLDQMLEALKTAAELREASRQMGRQTLRILNELSADRFVVDFSSEVESGTAPCHHPVVFGIVAAILDWPPRETASAFLYSTSATIVGASLRLLPLGQLAGQRVLWSVGSVIAALAESLQSKTEDDMWSFTPELEIAAMRHESLDARLFRS
jgi:urease accessory protein